MTNYFLLLFIEDTIAFLITLYFYILHNVIATLLLPVWSVSKTHFPASILVACSPNEQETSQL